MSRLPIRARLTLAFAVAMAIVLAGVGLLVYHRVGGALLSSVDQTLRSQAQEARLRTSAEGNLVDQDAAGGTTLAELVTANGTVIRSTPGTQPLLLDHADVTRAAYGETLTRSVDLRAPKGHWRVLAEPAGSGTAILVARSLEARHTTLERLNHELILAGVIGLLLAAGIGYALAASALRPVEAMRRRAAAVTTPSLTRLPVPPGGDEIARLATTLNEMLDRLSSAFEHERRFVADASHELRTPLALLRAELELALRRPRAAVELETALRSAAEETERLSRLAEELLFIARADQGALRIRRETVQVGETMEAVADRFAARAAELGRTVVAEESELAVDADPARLDQALSGLVDNALLHGDGDVVLAAKERGDAVEIHVSDEGEGFPPDFRARAFDRFSRADEARGRGGSGLGLSIVAVIAAAHGGEAGIGDGADVWISLPRTGASLVRRRRAAQHSH